MKPIIYDSQMRKSNKQPAVCGLSAIILFLTVGCSNVFVDAIVRTVDSEGDTDTRFDTATTEEDTGSEAPDGRIMESLGRGLVAVDRADLGVYVGWRLLASDSPDIAFNIYRDNLRVNDTPIQSTTDYMDAGGTSTAIYFIRSVIGEVETDWSETVGVLSEPYRRIPLSGDLSVNRVGIGDLDGDGEYDYVLRRPMGSAVSDITHEPSTDTFKVEGYNRNGARLWRIDLGWNIELGENYCPTIVYDLNGDNVAEIIQKTAEGTVDELGNPIIGDVDGDDLVDYRDENGRVLSGPEFLSVFSGSTGEELCRTNWIPRGNVEDWGDSNGVRANHNFMGIAYLDGKRPSIIAIRGIADLQKVWAFDYIDGTLQVRWTWSSANEGAEYINQGYHSIRVGDIDDDGRDEIIPGSYALDDDGRSLWTASEGHCDRSQLTDIDPSRPGLELWYCRGIAANYQNPVTLRDAASGNLLFGPGENWNKDTRAMAADIDPAYPGMELWGTLGELYDSKGNRIGDNPKTCNFAIYWDNDPLRELFDTNLFGGYDLFKWNYDQKTLDVLRTFEGDFVAHADIFGDWREEIIMSITGEIRIYTTVDPADRRIVTLVQDPVYRLSVAAQTMGLMQSTQAGFFIGDGMASR